MSLPFPLDPTERVLFWLGSQSTAEGWVREGDSVQLLCQGDGSPTPEYTFFRLQVTHPLIPLNSAIYSSAPTSDPWLSKARDQ